MSRFYLTTPIFYVNDAPHLGHAYTTVTGDAVCRWQRLLGNDVVFMTGTDEHGLKVQRAAEANGLTPQEQADQTSQRFREAWDHMNIAYDDYIRTTEPRHHSSVRAFMQRCYDNGHIYKGVYDGLYSVSDEAYVTQADVDEGRVSGPVERMTEENYFFKLSEFAEPLLEWFEREPENITPARYRNEALGIIKGGLADVSVTRTSLDWGIRVPWDESQVFYVWYDALINYATVAGFEADPDRFAAWWPATRHLLGKDIIRFHCVYWPAMLMAAGVKDLPKFHVHGWLLIGGEKMSKSRLNQISPENMTDEFGVDGFRYAMLRDTSFGPDNDFSYEALFSRYTSDLANAFGNLLGRVAAVVESKAGGIGPAPASDSPLRESVDAAYEATAAAWEQVQPSVALDATWQILRDANEYFQRMEPWKLPEGDEVNAVLGDTLECLRIATVLASPAIPDAAAVAWQRIGMSGNPADQRLPAAAEWGGYEGGAQVVRGDPLFPRISTD